MDLYMSMVFKVISDSVNEYLVNAEEQKINDLVNEYPDRPRLTTECIRCQEKSPQKMFEGTEYRGG